MTFNSYGFIFLFLPLVIGVFFIPGLRAWRTHALVLFSLVFYGFSGLVHVSILIASIVWVYIITNMKSYLESSLNVFIAITVPISALIYFKYSGFIIAQFTGEGGQTHSFLTLYANVLLPAGISFFTFQLVTYSVDRYRRQIDTPPTFWNFALYISFFPQLIAGPIVRYHQVKEALDNLLSYNANQRNFAEAISYLTLGLALKVIMADSLGREIQPMLEAPGELPFFSAVYFLLAYSFQVYGDFFGYSLMAIGMGRIFGFQLPMNFNRPFLAPDPAAFWRNWHITLMTFFSDYIWTPLTVAAMRKSAVNKYGMMGDALITIIIPITFVFMLSGLWHGASWAFVFWGLYQGIGVTFYRLVEKKWRRMPKLLQRVITFVWFNLSWVLVAFDFESGMQFTRSLLDPALQGSFGLPSAEAWMALFVCSLISIFVKFEALAEYVPRTRGVEIIYTSSLSVLFFVCLLYVHKSQTFLYFRF